MNDTTHPPTISEFGRLAGVGYCVAGLLSLASESPGNLDKPSVDGALATWLLVSEAVARNDDPQAAWPWLARQLHVLADADPWLEGKLRGMIASGWAAGLPALMCSDTVSRQEYWASFCLWAVPPNDEVYAIRQVLHGLLASESRNLFAWSSLEDVSPTLLQYESASAIAIIKVGLLLGDLKNLSSTETRPSNSLYGEWQAVLRTLLKRIQSLERIQRGFASRWPLFEDLILAILQAAEWLERPELYQIGKILFDLNKRPGEHLTANQLVLIGFLLGDALTYGKTAHWVQNRAWRQALSRQAAAQVANWSQSKVGLVMGVDATLFYCTASGSRSAFLAPCATPRFWSRQVKYTDRYGTVVVSDSEGTLQAVLLDAFELTIAFREMNDIDAMLPHPQPEVPPWSIT